MAFHLYINKLERVLTVVEVNLEGDVVPVELIDSELVARVDLIDRARTLVDRLVQNQRVTVKWNKLPVNVKRARFGSIEHRQKLSEARKKFLKNHVHRPNRGRKWSAVQRYKYSVAKKGKPSHWKGALWFHNPHNDESARFHPGKQPPGWIYGRGREWADDARVYIRRRWDAAGATPR